MIISKTPLRISFIGGGTDHLINERSYGSVIATSINKFIYLSLIPNHEKKFLVNYSLREKVDKIDQIKHPIVRETLKYFKIKNPIEIHVAADITSRGSGLGSSGTFSVGLINLLAKYKKLKLNERKLAEIAYYLETKKCKNISGKQDQYQSAFGGLNQIYFNTDGSVKVQKLQIDTNRLKKFERNLVIFNTNKTRKSTNIQMQLSFNKSTRIEFEILNTLLNNFKYELKSGDLDNCGRIMHQAWQIKKKVSVNTTNNFINKLYDTALENGALGGKILGAGGGGFLLFYCKQENQKKLTTKLKNLQRFNFKFYNTGSIIKNIN